MATEKREANISSMCIDDALGSDIVHNILSRLPAATFAFASCVNRSWNSICSRILSSPKLSSALSLNPSLADAVNEVVTKVLSEPTRPQFAVAYVGPSFSLTLAHELITERLSSKVPVVTSLSDGIIGRDAITNEFKELKWEAEDDDDDDVYLGGHENLPNPGILLTVGYLPGLKVNLIPLSAKNQDVRGLLIDEFVTNIREYTSSVSGSESPSAIILFTDLKTDMRPVLQKMDYAFSLDTIIVGDGGGRCLYRSDWEGLPRRKSAHIVPAVALLFVKERDKRPGIGETQFHVESSTGMQPVGPTYKAASVKEKYGDRCTWLTARRESIPGNLDGQTIIDNIYTEIGDRMQYLALYIGVKKRRKCSIGMENARCVTFLEFHEVMGGDEEYLYVNDIGIRTGDPFQFYVSDSNAALTSCNNMFENFSLLKQDDDSTSNQQTSLGLTDNSNKQSVFGGFIFCCRGRGESFFGQSNVDTMPFLESFPGVTLAGTFCSGEIKRGNISLYGQENQNQGFESCCLHVFSTVYLVLSYIPAQQQG